MLIKNQLEDIFVKHGFSDFKWIKGKEIIVENWVRFKCLFGCPNYGKKGTCPPNVPSVEECKAFFAEYEDAVIFHVKGELKHPDDRHDWCKAINLQLSALEREVFLNDYRKAFLMFIDKCTICGECLQSRVSCKNLKIARPVPESLAVDVFGTVRKVGYPIEVLKDYDQTMNRYGILLVQ
ncbi:MAG: metal-binding protein [Peptococcaceae bacterium BICA1-8]|nr:MAG: metal-binding protein [Peptococcaceae bacterium BICA1-8]